MNKFKIFSKIILLSVLAILVIEFLLFFFTNYSKSIDISSNKKLIVKLFDLKISKKNEININKNFNIFHPFIGWVHSPNSGIYITKNCQEESFLRTDNIGNSLVSNNYDNPDFNLVLTGGSTVFGVGSSSNNNTIASLIQKEFSKINKKVNIYNLGIRGAQSFQEFQRLYEFLSLNDKKIKTIISFSGRNDAIFARKNNDIKYSLLPKYSYDLSNKINKIMSHEFYINNAIFFKNQLVNNFYLFDVTYQIFKKIVLKKVNSEKNKLKIESKEKLLDYSNIKIKTSITANNYDLMFGVSKIFDVDYMMVLQPTIFTKNKYTADEIKCIEFDKNLKEFEDTFYAELYNKLKSKNYFYDFRSIFNKEENNIYVDNVHFNDEGAAIIAKRIYQILIQNYDIK